MIDTNKARNSIVNLNLEMIDIWILLHKHYLYYLKSKGVGYKEEAITRKVTH